MPSGLIMRWKDSIKEDFPRTLLGKPLINLTDPSLENNRGQLSHKKDLANHLLRLFQPEMKRGSGLFFLAGLTHHFLEPWTTIRKKITRSIRNQDFGVKYFLRSRSNFLAK